MFASSYIFLTYKALVRKNIILKVELLLIISPGIARAVLETPLLLTN